MAGASTAAVPVIAWGVALQLTQRAAGGQQGGYQQSAPPGGGYGGGQGGYGAGAGAGAGGPPKPRQMREGDWECTGCGNTNYAFR